MGIKIEADLWYTEAQLREHGEPFDGATLARARKSGELKARQVRHGRRVYKGAWLLAWLEKVEVRA